MKEERKKKKRKKVRKKKKSPLEKKYQRISFLNFPFSLSSTLCRGQIITNTLLKNFGGGEMELDLFLSSKTGNLVANLRCMFFFFLSFFSLFFVSSNLSFLPYHPLSRARGGRRHPGKERALFLLPFYTLPRLPHLPHQDKAHVWPGFVQQNKRTPFFLQHLSLSLSL